MLAEVHASSSGDRARLGARGWVVRVRYGRAVTTTLKHPHEFLQSRLAAVSNRMAAALETLAVLASPAVLYAVLRLRGMAPSQLPDPSMHTTFIIDPHDIFARYHALFTPSARLREGARVGFLVPARLAYQLFGAVPGFFAFRYLLALVAIVPLYLLLKKLYGRWAGFVGIAVVMSSPVVITAWGTDYPDSAAVSYLTGGLAALALSWQGQRWRRRWLAVAGALLTMAVWSHGASVPLVAALIVAYLIVRLRRERALLGRDLAQLAASAILVTGLLAICSKLLLGQFNFIAPTVKSAIVLSRASELRFSHSTSWSWAPYDPYLLVPPAIMAAFVAVVARKWRDIGTTQLFVGLTGALQLATFAFLQFFGSFQALEMHYFSSTLWSSINIMLAMTVVEVARPILGLRGAPRADDSVPERRGARMVQATRWTASASPALLVLAVALAYQAAGKVDLHVPAMTWAPWGAIVAAIVLVAAVIGRLTIQSTRSASHQRRRVRLLGRLCSASAVVIITGAALILTVAPRMPHGPLPNTVWDPPPAYAKALGGNDTANVAEYTVVSKLPGFVRQPAYRGELLLTWGPQSEFVDLQGPLGVYHNAITLVSDTFPLLSPNGARKIEAWHAAQVLLMSLTGQDFARAVRSLSRFRPVVVRHGILSDGWYHLHVWLVDLERYVNRDQAQRRHPLQRELTRDRLSSESSFATWSRYSLASRTRSAVGDRVAGGG